MNHLTRLAELANYPGTHDKDRYAREVRAEIQKVLDIAPLTPSERLILSGCHRLTSRTEPIETTRDRLRIALDLCTAFTPYRWRSGSWVTPQDETTAHWRQGELFSSPGEGMELMSRGVIDGFDPNTCTCQDQPEAICFAAAHTV